MLAVPAQMKRKANITLCLPVRLSSLLGLTNRDETDCDPPGEFGKLIKLRIEEPTSLSSFRSSIKWNPIQRRPQTRKDRATHCIAVSGKLKDTMDLTSERHRATGIIPRTPPESPIILYVTVGMDKYDIKKTWNPIKYADMSSVQPAQGRHRLDMSSSTPITAPANPIKCVFPLAPKIINERSEPSN